MVEIRAGDIAVELEPYQVVLQYTCTMVLEYVHVYLGMAIVYHIVYHMVL